LVGVLDPLEARDQRAVAGLRPPGEDRIDPPHPTAAAVAPAVGGPPEAVDAHRQPAVGVAPVAVHGALAGAEGAALAGDVHEPVAAQWLLAHQVDGAGE